MAPSLASAVTSAVLFSAAAHAASYQLFDSYTSDNFLDKFEPFVSDHTTDNYNDVDPTSGYVSYKSVAEAQELGILKTVGDEWYMGVDAKSTLNPSGIGRASVRLESTQKYNKGLFIADFSHLPKPACGTWPAFWTVGLPWPQGGEIDIYEAWNLDASSRFVMHTDASVGSCGIDGEDMTAEMSKPNCAGDAPGQGSGEGCAAFDSSAPYASSEGGIYAMEWTDAAIKIWAFTHDQVPEDLATNPNPDSWGAPRYRSANCEVGKVFDDAQLIMNIGFCGVAGHEGQWDECAVATGEADCPAYVANNPKVFESSFFQVRSIKVYQLGEGKVDDDSEGETETPVQSYDLPVTSSDPPASSIGYGLPEESQLPNESETPVQSYDLPVKPSDPPVKSSDPPASSIGYDLPEESELPEETEEPEETADPEDQCSELLPEETTSDALPLPPVETPPPTSSERLTTLTLTETSVATITSCPPEAAAECPGLIGSTTEIVIVTTTVCPVTDVATTLTVTRTSVKTATSCAPEVPDCPNQPETVIETEVIETTTPVAVTEPKSTPVETQSDALPVPSNPVEESSKVPEETIPPPPEESLPPAPEETPEETPSGPDYEPPQETPVSEPPVSEPPISEPPVSEPPQQTASDALPTPPVPSSPPVESEVPSSTSERLTTLTITDSITSTITSCPPEVATDCPVIGTTVVVEVTTTVCPVTDIPTTITISKTKVNTVTSCPPDIPDCPGVPVTTIETEIIETTTPVPVTESTSDVLPEQPTPPPTTLPTPEKPGKPVPEQPTPEQPTPEQPTPEQPVPEYPVPEQPTPEQPVPEQPVPEQPTPEQPTPEQPTPEQPVPEQPVPEQPTPEQPTPEQPIPEQPVPEQPTPEQPTPEQPEQPVYEPPVSQTVPLPPTLPTTLVTESFVATFTPPQPINSAFPTESTTIDFPLPAHGGPRLGAGALTLAAGIAAGVAAVLL